MAKISILAFVILLPFFHSFIQRYAVGHLKATSSHNRNAAVCRLKSLLLTTNSEIAASTGMPSKEFLIDPFNTTYIPNNLNYKLGQIYNGKAVDIKNSGAFINISTEISVHVPRAQLSIRAFEKLKSMVDSNSEESVQVELTNISEQDNSLVGKCIAINQEKVVGITTLVGQNLSERYFNATVAKVHHFGIFAELDGYYGSTGLIPISKLPERLPSDVVRTVYCPGTKLLVSVDELQLEPLNKKKITFGLKPTLHDVSDFATNSSDWIHGIVTAVSDYGLFVRPVGYECIGLVPISNIPNDVIEELSERIVTWDNIDYGEDGFIQQRLKQKNTTDEESPPPFFTIKELFLKTDVVLMRVSSVDVETCKLEFTMYNLPMPPVPEIPFVDLEERPPRFFELVTEEYQAGIDHYKSPGELVVWWRGRLYGDTVEEKLRLKQEKIDQFDPIKERKKLLKKQAAENAKRLKREEAIRAQQEEEERLQSEEDEDPAMLEDINTIVSEFGNQVNRFGIRDSHRYVQVGASIDPNTIPYEIRRHIDYFKEREAVNKKIDLEIRRPAQVALDEFDEDFKQWWSNGGEAIYAAEGSHRGGSGGGKKGSYSTGRSSGGRR